MLNQTCMPYKPLTYTTSPVLHPVPRRVSPSEAAVVWMNDHQAESGGDGGVDCRAALPYQCGADAGAGLVVGGDGRVGHHLRGKAGWRPQNCQNKYTPWSINFGT